MPVALAVVLTFLLPMPYLNQSTKLLDTFTPFVDQLRDISKSTWISTYRALPEKVLPRGMQLFFVPGQQNSNSWVLLRPKRRINKTNVGNTKNPGSLESKTTKPGTGGTGKSRSITYVIF